MMRVRTRRVSTVAISSLTPMRCRSPVAVVEVPALRHLRPPPLRRRERAVALRAQFLKTADGVGQQERTASTQQLWDDVGKSPVAECTNEVALAELRAEVGRDGVWRVSLP